MKILTLQEANQRLSPLGLTIGGWNEVKSVSGKLRSTSYHPSRENLLNFAHVIAGWLPKGDWKMLQIDNSTGWVNPVEQSLVGTLLFGLHGLSDLNSIENRAFLFEFGGGEFADDNIELQISHLMFVFLLLEMHGYWVSSSSKRVLGLQDGFAYFFDIEDDISKAKAFLDDFKNDPALAPSWLTRIFERRQR